MGTTNAAVTFSPASRGSVESLTTASRAEFAWMVDIPGNPLLRATSRSNASASRTSPTISRSGRMRNASFTSRRNGTSPVPSRLGWRHWSPTQSRFSRLSSKTSSQVTTRWLAGMLPARARTIVVFPACVAPETSTFRPAVTAASRKRAARGVSDPWDTRSSNRWARAMYLRMFTAHALAVIGGMATCNRSPPTRAASTKGWEMSSRRPEDRSIRSTRSRTDWWSRIVVVSSGRPERAMKIRPGSLIQISSTAGSSRYCWSGPRPATESSSSFATPSESPRAGTSPASERWS